MSRVKVLLDLFHPATQRYRDEVAGLRECRLGPDGEYSLFRVIVSPESDEWHPWVPFTRAYGNKFQEAGGARGQKAEGRGEEGLRWLINKSSVCHFRTDLQIQVGIGRPVIANGPHTGVATAVPGCVSDLRQQLLGTMTIAAELSLFIAMVYDNSPNFDFSRSLHHDGRHKFSIKIPLLRLPNLPPGPALGAIHGAQINPHSAPSLFLRHNYEAVPLITSFWGHLSRGYAILVTDCQSEGEDELTAHRMKGSFEGISQAIRLHSYSIHLDTARGCTLVANAGILNLLSNLPLDTRASGPRHGVCIAFLAAETLAVVARSSRRYHCPPGRSVPAAMKSFCDAGHTFQEAKSLASPLSLKFIPVCWSAIQFAETTGITQVTLSGLSDGSYQSFDAPASPRKSLVCTYHAERPGFRADVTLRFFPIFGGAGSSIPHELDLLDPLGFCSVIFPIRMFGMPNIIFYF
ncbi:hypothetical protein P691DRAFT_783829 [Macrolepiota fuliginosa MF-IS2]|uniref:Uncharacterized protein n=1 Tax=Macrolepiota fuliginosa MF-IS2 TaxID=1400762 RepID=A0A9P6C746_9AGAR|nr:hypothetical protein P691DRAFT_783829 [Macrolepiota fuliginosa MF-IS2]